MNMDHMVLQLFGQAIKNGTGEAILILLKNPSINFDKLILEACTHNLAYDPQCEGTRADYLFEILSLSKNKEVIENTILQNLIHAHEDSWDTSLLYDLGKTLASHGNQTARKALYERYSKNIEPGYEFSDTDALVVLDGLRGLEFSTDIQGKKITLDSEYWVCDWLLSVCQEKFPSSAPKKHLIEKAISNIHIKAYLSKIEEINDLRKNNPPRPQWSCSSIIEFINKGKPVPPFAGKKFNEDEITRLVNAFQKERDDKKIVAYLRVLSKVKYPDDISYVIQFLSSNNNRITHFALSILSKISAPVIRNIIESNYNNLNYLKGNLRLFVSNYKPNDIEVLSKIVEQIENEDEIHSVIGDVIDLLKNNSINKPSKLLNPLYKKNNCSICRLSMIEILMLSDDLQDDIFQELKYDCEFEIRELSYNYKQKKLTIASS